MKKLTLIVGASENPERYSYLAAHRLQHYGVDFIALGLKPGEVAGKPILTGQPNVSGVHTVTLYVNPARQNAYYDYIFSLQPKRVIFNPGTENDEFAQQLENKGIEAVQGCTLVMLSSGTF
jgi:uncharacterized protein